MMMLMTEQDKLMTKTRLAAEREAELETKLQEKEALLQEREAQLQEINAKLQDVQVQLQELEMAKKTIEVNTPVDKNTSKS